METRIRRTGITCRLYYENMEGGHGGTSNQEQLAHRIALEYTFFARELMDDELN